MVGVRLFIGAASLVAGLAAAGLTAAQQVAPQGVSARAFALEASALRSRAETMDAQAQALGATATAEARAQQLRQAALARVEAALLATAAGLETTQARATAQREALAGVVMAAWFAQRAQADDGLRASLRFAGAQVVADSGPAQAQLALAQGRTQRLRQARTALSEHVLAGETRLQDQAMAMAALGADHNAVLERMALADARARLLRADPDAAGTPAPRLAAALFGPGGARTVLGRSEAQPGVTFAGAPGQVVVAPESGRIRFSGAYRSYGQVLVLELDSGYTVVFAGLEGDASPISGVVRAGSVVGTFNSNAAVAPELYVEVRRSARPVDPEQVARTWRVASVEPPPRAGVVLASGP